MSRTLRFKGKTEERMWGFMFVQENDLVLDEDGKVDPWFDRRCGGLTRAEANVVKRALFHADGHRLYRKPGDIYRLRLRKIHAQELRRQLAAFEPCDYDAIVLSPHCNNRSWW